MTRAIISATHVLCSIGRGTEQAWASVRAGIARIGNSHVMNRHFEPIQMGLVPEDALGTLTPDIEALPLPSRARRMLRLATPVVEALAADLATPVPLFIGAPELTATEAPWLRHLPAYLHVLTGAPIDIDRSVVIPRGRASAIIALELALKALDNEETSHVIVGGVDTYLDLRLLSTLDAEGRISGPRVMDGFIPGEGAAFVVLTNASLQSADRTVAVNAAASVKDPGHRYGQAPATGEGLSNALQQARDRMSPLAGPIATTFAGFNGENFDAKLWGIARMRHNDLFAPNMLMEHPADKYGDAGAATGAILLSLASHSLTDGSRFGPALVWAASDYEPRACAVLSLVTA